MRAILTIMFVSFFLTVACSDPPIAEIPEPAYQNGTEYIFESTIIGETSESELIILTNTGQGDLEIDQAELLSNTGEYDISDLINQLPMTVRKNDTLEFKIKFTPDADSIRGSHKNKLILSGSDALDDFVLTVNAPVNAPEIKLSPSTLTFSTTTTQILRITNIGNAILTIDKDVRINNPNFEFADDFTIPAGTKICPEAAAENNTSCANIEKKIIATVNYNGDPGSTEDGNIIIYNDGVPNSDVSRVYLTAAINVCHLYVTNLDNDALDFGSVFISSTANKNIALINTGGADCTLNNIEVISADADIFGIAYLDNYPAITEPIIIPTRNNATSENPNQYIFKVSFTPASETNYTGTLKLTGSDPSWDNGKVEIPLLGTGTTATDPVAKCDIEVNGLSLGDYAEVEPAIDGGSNPPSIITLNGSESFDPNGGVLTYKWEKISAPTGSTAVPRTPTAARSTYFVDLSGEHKLQLTVTNEAGMSATCTVTAAGITSNALHVELFWDKNGDVDLHFKKYGTNDASYGTDNDCFWGNACARGGLDWGSPGEINNPKLDRDDITGRGPENVNLDTPEVTPTGEYYTVGVKNFSHRSNPTATVIIYCNGGPQLELSMGLPTSGSSFWYVAGIQWTTSNSCNINVINTLGSYPGATGTR